MAAKGRGREQSGGNGLSYRPCSSGSACARLLMRLRDECPCDGWPSPPEDAWPAADWLDDPPLLRFRAEEKRVMGCGGGSGAAAGEEDGERGVGRGRERGLLLAELLPLDAPLVLPLESRPPDRWDEPARDSALLLLALLLPVRVVDDAPPAGE